MSQNMKMSEPLEPNLSELTSSAEGSPAKTLAVPAIVAESSKELEVDCGVNTLGYLGCFDQDSYLLKMSQVCLLTSQCDEYSGTFTASGSMRNGKVFLRPRLVPLSYEIEFSYLPSPDASLGNSVTFSAEAWAMSWLRKETTGVRPSGAKIGSSLGWCREYIQEYLRTGGELNPSWLEALMGFPTDWNELSLTEMPSSPKSQNGSDAE